MNLKIHYQNNAPKTKKALSILVTMLMLCVPTITIAESPQSKAVWYRYYDKNGVANISSSVTPAHVRHGYEALDRNMQVIKKNKAYDVEKDLQQSSIRAAELRKLEQDNRLKRAYGNSNTATNKRNEALQNILKQIEVQNKNLKQLQNDRIALKRQEIEYYRKGSTVPVILKDHLKYNNDNIAQSKSAIENLQVSYRNTKAFYDDIINRLKKME